MIASQRGVALITAMLIVSLVTVIGAAMLSQLNLSVHRAGNLWQNEQAWWYAVGVENWIGQILRVDRENSEVDNLEEGWAQPVDYLPIEGGAISGQLLDLQGRFNLNNLNSSDAESAVEMFQRMIQRATDADQITARTIAQSTRDWIDEDINPTLPNGAEDDYYLGLQPPYRSANQTMVSVSELRLVRDVNADIYRALAPHVTVLPEATRINVNTATPLVLLSLAEELDPSAVESLIKKRAEEPWDSVQAFLQEDELAGVDIPADRLSVSTSYFRAAGEVAVDRSRVRFFSVLKRNNAGITKVLRHSRDVY